MGFDFVRRADLRAILIPSASRQCPPRGLGGREANPERSEWAKAGLAYQNSACG